jgi:hypothetical protein
MNDALFDTLAAVAMMCSSYIHQSTVLDNHGLPIPGTTFEKGFEDCPAVIKRYEDEIERRAADAAKAKVEADKQRLQNALVGSHGGHFEPEAAPPAPKIPFGGCSYINTDPGIIPR